MKKFLFWLGIVVSFLMVLSEVVPLFVAWHAEYKEKKAKYDADREAEENPLKEERDNVVNMEAGNDGVFRPTGTGGRI